MTVSAAQIMSGRRESAWLALPSVQHFVEILGRRCREESWVRTSVASLDRFATLTGYSDLEALLVRAQRDHWVAADTLLQFASKLGAATRTQNAALAIGPKLWFTFNGVEVPWRSPDGADWTPHSMAGARSVDRLILLALVGSGLHRSELLRLTLGDIGRLDANGNLVADLDADPLAVRYVQRRDGMEYITFFTDPAREALERELERRRHNGESLGPQSPLVANALGTRATASTAARASRFNTALVSAGNAVNVDMCRKTGEFFRTWGQPGARFDASLAIGREAE